MIDFHKPYSASEFEDFLREFLPEDFEIQNKELLPGVYWKCIKEGKLIWSSKQLGVSILEFLHEKDTDPRVTLTKESFRILAETNNRKSLVIFRNHENKRYRFSLITIDLDVDDNNKITKNYSNAKRYSFLLWEWEPVKTPTEQLKKKVSNFQDLKECFNVEVVRKQFFDDYFDLFIRLYIAISADKNFCDVLSRCWVDRVKFSKNLLGKIVFAYFIQKKWWLGVKKNENWWTGDRKFLRTLWNRFANGEDFVRLSTWFFYNDYLEHLFYNGFNKDRRDDDDYEPNMRFRVPYLNGGLFKEDYEGWETFTAKIPNEIFSNVEETGILDYFDLYNFTIDEDDPLNAEIAVDPEMLGKIFEKMISVSKDNIDEIVSIYKKKGKAKIGTELNKKFWAFYTPREIVHYMCQESLIQYLLQATKIEEGRVRDLVKRKEFSNDWKNIDTYNHFTLEEKTGIDRDIALIDEKLQKIKILDPAVWSGAFPMGLLHEISGVRWYFRHHGFIKDSKSLYVIKKETIQESIYGVDIEPGAIDIARLRFWLSLIVDEEEPEPLPNFEFKFVCANTLIPLSDEEAQLDIFWSNDEANLNTLKRYKRDYYKASGKKEKEELKSKIRKYTEIGQITLGSTPSKRAFQMHEFWENFDNPNYSHSFFDSSLMLGEWRGFDVVIWNPPYLLCQESNVEEDLLKFYKTFQVASYKIDLFHLFFERWILLLKTFGSLSYITPSTYLTNKHTESLRRYMLSNWAIKEIANFEDWVFENASVDTCITRFQKWYSAVKNIVNISKFNKSKEKLNKTTLDHALWEKSAIFNINQIGESKVFKNTVPLWEKYHTYFWIQAFDRNSSISWAPVNGSFLPMIDWADIRRLSLANPKIYFCFEKEKIKSGGDLEVYKRERAVVRQIGNYPICGYCKAWILTSNTIYNIYPKDLEYSVRFIEAILNSSFVRNYWKNLFSDNKATFPKIKGYQLKQIPIPITDSWCKKQERITELVIQIENLKLNDLKAETGELELELDRMVCGLYESWNDSIKS